MKGIRLRKPSELELANKNVCALRARFFEAWQDLPSGILRWGTEDKDLRTPVTVLVSLDRIIPWQVAPQHSLPPFHPMSLRILVWDGVSRTKSHQEVEGSFEC
jgi:hypothetical protein